MSPSLKRLLRAALLCSIVVALAPLPASATGSAARADNVPCWKQVLNDWYDGSIDKIYPLHCYSEAIDQLPIDVKLYSSARDDIQAAQAAAAAGKPAPHEAPTTTVTTTDSNGQTITTTTTTTTPPHKKSTGIAGIIHRITPGNPDAFPLPLLILGALALLLVASGAAGMLWQRSHPRGPDSPAE